MLSFTVTPSVCMSSLAVLYDPLCGHRPADLGSTEAKKGSRAKPGTPCRWGYEGGVARVCACHVWRREATRLVVCAVEVVRVAVLVLECNPVRVGVGSSLSRQAIRRLGSPLPPQGVLRVDPLDQVAAFYPRAYGGRAWAGVGVPHCCPSKKRDRCRCRTPRRRLSLPPRQSHCRPAPSAAAAPARPRLRVTAIAVRAHRGLLQWLLRRTWRC